MAPAKLFATVPARLDNVVSIAYEAPEREESERKRERMSERERNG